MFYTPDEEDDKNDPLLGFVNDSPPPPPDPNDERAARPTEAGNIDLTHRPHVQNSDGTTSTVRSIGVNIDGQEVEIPTVSDDGRIMSDDEAIQTYRRTGKHLGKYSSIAAGNAAGEQIHQDQMAHPPIDTLKKPADHATQPWQPSAAMKPSDPGAYAFEPPAPDAPTKTSLLDDEGAQWAALFDTFLNGGRGVGKILGAAAVQKSKKQSETLDDQYKQAQIDHLRGTGPNADQLDIQRQRLLLQAQGIAQGNTREHRLLGHEQDRIAERGKAQDPNSAQMQGIRKLIEPHLTPDQMAAFDNITMESMKYAAPVVNKEVETGLVIPGRRAKAAGEKAGAVTASTLDTKHNFAPTTRADKAAEAEAVDAAHAVHAKELAQQRTEGNEAGRGDLRERQFQERIRSKFVAEHKEDLDVAGLINEIEHSGGITSEQGSAAVEAAAVKSTLVERGLVDPKRLDVVSAHRLILEFWGRALTGKAGTSKEDQQFARETAADAFASPEIVESRFRQLSGVVQRRLREGALGNPSAVDLVGIQVDDPVGYLGYTEDQVKSWRRPSGQQPSAAPVVPGTDPASNPRQTAAGQPPPTAATPPPMDPETADLQGFNDMAEAGLPTQGSVPAQPIDPNGSVAPDHVKGVEEANRRAVAGGHKAMSIKRPKPRSPEDEEAERLIQQMSH